MVLLGKISKNRGNRGEVVCQISPGIDLSGIDLSGSLELRSEKYIKSAKMVSYSERGSSLVIKFDISNSINDALGLIGYEVYLDSPVKSESVFDFRGFLVKDLSGERWGVVTMINSGIMNATFEIENGDESIIIPFNESIIVKIDKKNREILIDPPDGLKDLNKK